MHYFIVIVHIASGPFVQEKMLYFSLLRFFQSKALYSKVKLYAIFLLASFGVFVMGKVGNV